MLRLGTGSGQPSQPSTLILTPPSKWSSLAILGLSIVAVACACTSYFASASIYERCDVRGLRQPNRYPGLEIRKELRIPCSSSDTCPGRNSPLATLTVSFPLSKTVLWRIRHILHLALSTRSKSGMLRRGLQSP